MRLTYWRVARVRSLLPRVRLSRRLVVGIAVALFSLLAVSVSFGPIVRARVETFAERRGMHVQIGSVSPRWFGASLGKVDIESIDGVRVNIQQIDVDIALNLRPRSVAIHGGSLVAEGNFEDLLRRWRANRRPADESATASEIPLPIRGEGVSLNWQAGVQKVTATGMSFARDSHFRIGAVEARFQDPRTSIEIHEGVAEFDESHLLAHIHADAVGIALRESHEHARPGANVEPPSAPVGDPQEPADSSPWSLPIRRLREMYHSSRGWARQFAERTANGTQVTIDSLAWQPAEGESASVRVGSGPLTIVRNSDFVRVDFSSRKDMGGTPIALHSDIPLAELDWVTTLEGGPVPLASVGIVEGALGLANVAQATIGGRARLGFGSRGDQVSFDADLRLHDLAVTHSRLAEEMLRGIDAKLSVRGVAASNGKLELDEGSFRLGKAEFRASGTMQETEGNTSVAIRFEVPARDCQSLIESAPTALLPTIHMTKLAGSFSLKGEFKADSRKLDQLTLSYSADDQCRFVEVPSELSRDRFRQSFSYRIYLPNGTPGEATTGPGTPRWTEFDQISPYMSIAVRTTEDGAFFRHKGFNHGAIRNALVANLKEKRFVRGASTISMQLAKNIFLKRNKTLARKLEEVALTDYLEQSFSKEEILELYLNVIEFGPNMYGIADAAEHYFGRAPDELSLAESFFLASILPAPIRYHGMRDKGVLPEYWAQHIRKLLEISNKVGLITREEMEAGKSETIVFYKGGPRPVRRTPTARVPHDFGAGNEMFDWDELHPTP